MQRVLTFAASVRSVFAGRARRGPVWAGVPRHGVWNETGHTGSPADRVALLSSVFNLLPMSFATNRYAALASLLVFSLGTAHAQPVPFDVAWVGYNVGTSAYPGNPEPYERDPYGIASADFDGDGDMDVVVANYDYAAPGGTDGSSGFALLFNAGDGTYGEAVHYTFTDKGSFDVVVGDFDEDGHPDLALPNSGRITGEHGNTVVVFLNDGTGAFTQAGEFLVTERPRTLAVGDFDGDGHLDLVADSYRFSSEHVAVLFGTGTGSFGPRVLVPVGDLTQGVSAADLDGDGSDDIMTSVFGDLCRRDERRERRFFGTGDGRRRRRGTAYRRADRRGGPRQRRRARPRPRRLPE